MKAIVYILCALASFICTVLLYRGYRSNRTPLLFWSSICFAGLTLNNILLFTDMIIFPENDLSFPRNITTTVSLVTLLFGLIWETV